MMTAGYQVLSCHQVTISIFRYVMFRSNVLHVDRHMYQPEPQSLVILLV